MILKILLIVFSLFVLIVWRSGHNVVSLQTIESNGGFVSIRSSLDKDWHQDVLVTTYCTRLDGVRYKTSTFYYYKVDCDGIVGFVSTTNVK